MVGQWGPSSSHFDFESEIPWEAHVGIGLHFEDGLILLFLFLFLGCRKERNLNPNPNLNPIMWLC